MIQLQLHLQVFNIEFEVKNIVDIKTITASDTGSFGEAGHDKPVELPDSRSNTIFGNSSFAKKTSSWSFDTQNTIQTKNIESLQSQGIIIQFLR